MKTLIKTLLITVILGSLGSTALLADAKKGQKIYLKTLKAKFGMNGTKFASLHTVEEWEELFEDEGEAFIEEFSQRFPKAKKVLTRKNSWKKLQHVKDFAIKYASDSGNVPSCG